MAGLLNYQPSHSAVYYTSPKRIDVRRTLIGFALAVVAVSIGAAAYGHILPKLEDLYFRVGAVVMAAIAVGVIGLLPVRYGQVRIPLVAAFIGAILSLIALYVMWLVWVHHALNWGGFPISYRVLLAHPILFSQLVQDLNAVGTWSYKNQTVNGFPLTILWLGEAGLILAVGVLLPIHRLFSDEPVCLACGNRCHSVRNLPRFADDRQDEFVAAIENREFQSIASHDAALHEDDPELTMRLVSCQYCNKTNVLTVNHIAWYIDSNDLVTVKTDVLINQLLITPKESEELKMICEEIRERRAAESAGTSKCDPPQSETPSDEA